MRRLIVAVMVPLLALPTPLAAQRLDRDGTRPSYAKCQEASGGITVNMLDCIGAEYDFQDGVLNARYKRTMARLSPAKLAALRESQRRWLKQREPECMKEIGEDAEGTLGNVLRNQCMLGTLIERIDWLDKYKP